MKKLRNSKGKKQYKMAEIASKLGFLASILFNEKT